MNLGEAFRMDCEGPGEERDGGLALPIGSLEGMLASDGALPCC